MTPAKLSSEGSVDPDLRVRTKNVDPALLGSRVRIARQRAGLTQGEAAADDMSTAYISRIEAGQRRPNVELLVRLAARLGCDPEDLVAPGSGDDAVDEQGQPVDADLTARLTLELDYAELALRTGDGAGALTRTEQVLTDAAAVCVPADLRFQARLLRALALETTGSLDEVIIALEDVVADSTGPDRADTADPVGMLRALTALSRCYRESGDLARAVDVGERAQTLVDQTSLHGTAEGLQLAVTVAAAHFERGDTSHAVRLCLRAVERADELDSPMARAAAYWNTSVMEAEQGRVNAALPLAQKAIALLDQTHEARNQAQLRGTLGMLQLRQNPPDTAAALVNLNRAAEDMEWNDASETDRADIRLGLAKAHFQLGDPSEAALLAEAVFESVGAEGPLIAAEARVLQGRIAADAGRMEEAVGCFHDAILVLSGHGADRNAAQLWFDLGGLLQEHGQVEEAVDAYRRAAASTGLTSPASQTRQRQTQA